MIREKWKNLIVPKEIKRLESGTLEEWDDWEENYKTKFPIRYWLTERLPSILTVFRWSYIRDPIWWVKYRTTHQYHYIKTGLKPGYYDTDHVLEKTLIAALKQHIEGEVESFYYDEWKKVPKAKQFEFIVQKREEFIAELKAETEYPTTQWVAEQEILDIYRWIKTDYETWKEEYYDVGVESFHKRMKELGHDDRGIFGTKYPEPYKAEYHALLDAMHDLETKRRNEVDAMLLRIVKVRHSLWF
jgi:hypothetical protein